MKLADKTQCTGCGACTCKCSNSAITMKADNEGFLYPHIDVIKCIDCGVCRSVCPVLNPKNKVDGKKVSFGAMSKDENILKLSSSGGIFTELSKIYLNKAGVVFGAAYTDDYKSVLHICVDNEKDLDKLRGSKYAQSNTYEIYKSVKQFLDQGRYVLFSGVPCQIKALNRYLNKEYPRLLTVEVVCHGVPSAQMHGDYIEYLQNKYKSGISSFSQRYKRLNLSGPYYYHARFINGKEYKRVLRTDYIGYFYNQNLIYRPSCYNCQAKQQETSADLTIGDFWGAENYSNFKSGNSSIIVANTKKGLLAIEEMRGRVDFVEMEFSTISRLNKSMVSSANMPIEREECIKDYLTGGFSNMVNRHYKISLKDRIKIALDSFGILDAIVDFKKKTS